MKRVHINFALELYKIGFILGGCLFIKLIKIKSYFAGLLCVILCTFQSIF